MPPPCVFIVILQYNNSQDTTRCLNSVKELDYPNYEVIIVDNASNIKYVDEIRLFLRNLSPKTYHLKPITSNLGYSGGNNIGIKQALERGADYVFILNPDTTVEKNVLTKLVETAESDYQTGVLGPAINEGNQTIYGGKIKWLKPELSHLEARSQKLKTSFYVPGTAMLIKLKVIERIGLLDERYFLYFEDVDYCVRAQRAGFKLTIVPKTKVNHAISASTSQLGAPLLLRYHYRNAHLFNWKNGPLWARLTLPFWSIFIIIKQLAKIILGRNFEISKAILGGVLDFYRNRFGKINA
ncbi:MAG: glycosyltransferase family 2 protein [Candidatus Yanofskybacteria bacterium]|nr:glycosyltransferase family 2 protein [Candidatus Yanofskybacteria bacterium]